MQDMFAGYMWLSSGGSYGTWHVRWEQPRLTVADHSLWDLRLPGGQLLAASAWIRSVTVRDPSTGQETIKDSPHLAAVRIENNAVSVTYGLNASFNCEIQGLVHAFWWS